MIHKCSINYSTYYFSPLTVYWSIYKYDSGSYGWGEWRQEAQCQVQQKFIWLCLCITSKRRSSLFWEMCPSKTPVMKCKKNKITSYLVWNEMAYKKVLKKVNYSDLILKSQQYRRLGGSRSIYGRQSEFSGPSSCFHSTVLIHFIRMTHELQLWLVRNGLDYIWIQRQPALFFIRRTAHKLNTLMFPKHTLCLWDVQYTASEGSNQKAERQTEGWWKRLVEKDHFWVCFCLASSFRRESGVNNHSNET